MKNPSNSTNFFVPLSLFTLLYIILITSLTTLQYTKSLNLKKLQNSIMTATYISKLVHSTQKERGYSSAFITSHSEKFYKKLQEQRVITDARLQELRKLLPLLQKSSFQQELQTIIKNMSHIEKFRKSVDRFQYSSAEIIEYYSAFNTQLLNMIVEIAKYSKIPSISQETIAYSHFLYAKEYAGIERALGSVILAQNKFVDTQKIALINIIHTQKIYTKLFTQYSTKESYVFYKQQQNRDKDKELERLRLTILNNDSNFNITPYYWFTTLTQKIDALQKIDNYLEKNIIKHIHIEITSSQFLTLIYFLVLLIGILIFTLTLLFTKKLVKSQKRLKEIADKYIISSITDTKGKITSVSDAFCKISQYSREELIGKSHNIVRHPDMPKTAFKDMWKTILEGKTWKGEVKNLKKDGGYYWVYANVEPLFDTSGKIEGFTAIRLDITDKFHLEKELQENIKKDKLLLQQSKLAQMGELINMIAHQWRQPLTAISATVGDLLVKLALNKYRQEYFETKLNNIHNFSQHLSSTIDDFRSFYKEDKERRITNFKDIVEDSLKIVDASLRSNAIKIYLEFTSQKEILSYPNELKQVVLNLIKNAEDIFIEKRTQNAQIRIRSYEEEGLSCLEVYDNAQGVPEEIIDKIFDPYFSTKTKKDGTGLGLYMSKTIIEDHCDGELRVENREEGACFIIRLNT